MPTEVARAPVKKLTTLDVWALAVGIVVCGQFFGWNLGLAGNGPVAMLLASLFVCVLFVGWLLVVSELTVAMPYADGPLRYGQVAGDPGLGFVMAWSLLLACQFGAIATAIATGYYVAFLIDPADPSAKVAVSAGLGTVVFFFLVQLWGVKEQAWVLIAVTIASLVALLIYWVIATTNFSWERVYPPTTPLGAKGWRGALDAIPYALWWLIIIEGAALSAEECREPGRSIPRGLIAAVATVVVMIVLTLGLGCGALESEQITDSYPLGKIAKESLAGRFPWLLLLFGILALFGLVASYHGLLYSVSRQAMALGRAGYLPLFLGVQHVRSEAPVNALLVSSVVSAGFVSASYSFRPAIEFAILVAGIASLVWYILATCCLIALRRRSPEMFAGYRAPFGLLLPLGVILMSLIALVAFVGVNAEVLPLAALLYEIGLICYFLSAHRQVGATRGNESWEAEKS